MNKDLAYVKIRKHLQRAEESLWIAWVFAIELEESSLAQKTSDAMHRVWDSEKELEILEEISRKEKGR